MGAKVTFLDEFELKRLFQLIRNEKRTIHRRHTSKNIYPRKNIVVRVSDERIIWIFIEKSRFIHLVSEAENETINRELEKQFNESLQSKITHTRHGGLGFQGSTSSASSSNDWHDHSSKTAFVPASEPVDETNVEEKKKKKKKETKSET